jgi:hypothetical protein
VNGKDEPEEPERLPSLFDRLRKMLKRERLVLYLAPEDRTTVTRTFFLDALPDEAEHTD